MNELKTDYNFSNDYLMFKVGDVVGYMNRDVTEFTARNITQVDIDAFEAEGDAYESILPDSYYRSQITIEVDDKNTARAACQIKARKIAGYVEQAYGPKSGQYKSLNYGSLNGARDRSFITGARLVAKAAEGYLPTVSTYGLTQGMIDDLITEAQLMEDKLHAIAQKEGERDIITNDRISAGNALYEKLVKYCTVGKAIWEDVNEAKYNDYVINPTVTQGLPKAENLMVVPDQGEPNDAVLTWNTVIDATEYEVYVSEVPLGEPYGTFSLASTVPLTQAVYAMTTGVRYWFKVRGKNASKTGYFSDEVFLDN
jgi:hypothetical protein